MSDLIDPNYSFKCNLPLEGTLIFEEVYKPELQLSLNEKQELNGDSDECDHSIPAQADHPFRAKLTRAFRGKLTTPNA